MRPSFRRPARALPRPSKVKTKPEPDLKLLADAANEAAKREAAQWFYFVTIMLTLAAIVGSTTHRVLFLEDPVKVPILSVELPLRGFYLAAPTIFVVLHFYLLAQLRLMVGKVRTFLDAVETGHDTTARGQELNRLDTFSVAQLVVAGRYGRIAPAVRAMVWVTLVAAPVLLLLFFQLRFLPFHSEWITWWHRGLLAMDLALMWALWPPLESGPPTRIAIHAARGIAAGTTLGFAVFLATIPDEWADLGGPKLPLRAALFGDLSPDDIGVDQQPTTLFSRRLILPDQDFVSEDEKTRAELLRTRVLRRRHLEFAVLDRADLRKADLTGAFLRGASLSRAQMQGASLIGAQMQGALLHEAQLQDATLDDARLEDARLADAQLQGVSLRQADLRGAQLLRAKLQGAWLPRAQMQGAWLQGAQLQGAGLERADLRGGSLANSQLQGASLVGANLAGASLSYAQMQGVLLAEAQLQASSMKHIAAWRLDTRNAKLDDARISMLQLDKEVPCIGPVYAWSYGRAIQCNSPPSWSSWIEATLEAIPEGDRRTWARRRLESRFSEPDATADTEPAEMLQAFPEPNNAAVAERLGNLACDPSHAPYVARGIYQQIAFGINDLGPSRANLAGRLTNSESCPGARGLEGYARARLVEIAAGRD